MDRFFPSSKTCSRCRTIKDNLKLSDRLYNCNSCNLVIDRNLNASLNINGWQHV
ncbi:Transposase [hydrothermal vent metagenome]|uniref:Transposase n=1 Tax=hydrothermal vent metagenome TaxID=652676 RepID=A0A1W1CJN3_9ZZZZ